MKKLIVILTLFVAAQSSAQEFSPITTEEINYKVCSFDKDADAVIFFDKAVAQADDRFNLVTKRSIKFKILKESGVSKGDYIIPYYSKDDFEQINEVYGYVFNTQGDKAFLKVNIDKKSIFRTQRNEFWSQLKMAFPQVRIGSIIELTYTSVRKNFSLRDWEFQSDDPTLFSQFDITILAGAEFAYKINKSPNLPIDVKSLDREGRMIFTMKDIAGLRYEPYMDAPEDYKQKIVFEFAKYNNGNRIVKGATTWPELAKSLLNESGFGRAIEKKIKEAEPVLAPIRLIPSDYDRMVKVYDYVRKNFSYSGISGPYAQDGVKKVWDKKTGDAGELNLLLINLLREVNLEVNPLLVSERRHGKVDPSYPSADQFNKVMAHLVLNGKQFVLDATDQITPPDFLPFDLLNTYAFPVIKKAGNPILLTEADRSSKDLALIQATVTEDGTMKGEVQVISRDYSRIERKAVWQKSGSKQFASTYFLDDVTNVTIDSLELTNVDVDTLALEQRFKFGTSVPASGDYRMVNLNLFGPWRTSPFTSDNRFTNINFGCPVLSNITQVITIPKTMQPDAMPKSVSLVMPDKSISFTRMTSYDANQNTISVRLSYQVTRPVFGAEEYVSIKDFYKKMVEMLNEPLVLKSK